LPRITIRGSGPSVTRPGRYGSDGPRTPCVACLSEPAPRRFDLHIREFGLFGFQDCLAVEPDRDTGAGALVLDRLPLGSRPRRVGGRAFVSIIRQSSLDARASVLSRAMSGRQGRCPRAGFQYTRFAASEGVQPRSFRVLRDHRVPVVPAWSGPSSHWRTRHAHDMSQHAVEQCPLVAMSLAFRVRTSQLPTPDSR
jgi:hypothetical protein